MAKQGGELVTECTWVELKKAILDEVLSLEKFMQVLYSKFGTMHKVVVHLNGWQRRCARRACIFSNVHNSLNYMQTWKMRYKGASLHLPKMMKPKAFTLKIRVWSQIRNYEDLPHLITSLQASHAQVFRNMDVFVRTHAIPSIVTLNEAKTKAQVWLDLDELMHISTSADLVINADTIP